jgi:ADP-ribosylglycohydrolase
MILEAAIGDAYGAGFEYVSASIVREKNDLSAYHKHLKWHLSPGNYTDDTQMGIGVAELIVEGKEWTPLNIANKFVEVFHRDHRKGYAQGFYHFLCKTKNGEEFLKNIRPDSNKSGGAMRAWPCGVFPTITEVIKKCEIQASITHNTSRGINSACAVALATHYFLYDLGPKDGLGRFLNKHVSGEKWDKPWKGKVGGLGTHSTSAAITAVVSNNSLSDILKMSVDYTGDVDTVACEAMAIASCSKEVIQDLPNGLYENLENGLYGLNFLKELDKKLLLIPSIDW